jgi:hypothetical protein
MKTGNPAFDEGPECPRCAELRGRAIIMNTIRKGAVATAYECRSCDYTIPLAYFASVGQAPPIGG